MTSQQTILPGPQGAVLAMGDMLCPNPHISQPRGYRHNGRLVWMRPDPNNANDAHIFGIDRRGDWHGVYSILPRAHFREVGV